MLISGNDPNANQDQKADLTFNNVGTGQDKRKTVDPVSKATKLEVKLNNPDPEKDLIEETVAQDDQPANPLQVLLETAEKWNDLEATKGNMADQVPDSQSTLGSDLGKQDSKARMASPVLAQTSSLKMAPEPQPPSTEVSPSPSLADPETRFLMSPSCKAKWFREFGKEGFSKAYLDAAHKIVLDFKRCNYQVVHCLLPDKSNPKS
jgi:hypothetical protein